MEMCEGGGRYGGVKVGGEEGERDLRGVGEERRKEILERMEERPRRRRLMWRELNDEESQEQEVHEQ